MWQESHMGRETRESKVARLERPVGRRSCGSSDMWTCQKIAQWGPIAEDDDLAGRKCEKGASPSTNKLESLSHDTATTCAFVMMRPIANTRLLLSQRISGCNRAPLVAFSDTRAQKQRNRNARQPASKQPTNVRRPNAAKARACMPDIQNAARSNHARQAIKMRPRHGHICQASKNKRAEAATRRSVGIANASPGDSRERTAAQPCMSRRAIKCAYGGEIEFIPP